MVHNIVPPAAVEIVGLLRHDGLLVAQQSEGPRGVMYLLNRVLVHSNIATNSQYFVFSCLPAANTYVF